MEELLIPLILLGVGCLLCGPIALIVSLIALNRSQSMYQPPVSGQAKAIVPPAKPPVRSAPVTVDEQDLSHARALPQEQAVDQPVAVKPPEEILHVEHYSEIPKPPAPKLVLESASQNPKMLLEQRIGTRWLLIAGVVTIFFGVAFFLRYAYTYITISDQVKVMIAVVSGLAALGIGEITRRRGYEIVAKGVTALGFAILYLSVFCAQLLYGLIGAKVAFTFAAVVTAGAMAYAVVLDEILIAFLSLLGGFMTPVIVSTGENVPNSLFVYVTVLSLGAMICDRFREWRAINFLAFIGTFILYTGWFEKFYRPEMNNAVVPEQMGIALGWLGVFFVIYLVMPIFYELTKETKARKEDVLLVLANAAVILYYLCTVLFSDHRSGLALSCVGLCAAHMAMMAIAYWRCKDDSDLHLVLLAIGLFFLTLAIPLYFRMNAIVIAWALEAVVLIVIGLKYKSVLTQAGGGLVLILSCCKLLLNLPMHDEAFRFVLNPIFGTFCFVCAAALLSHILYRRDSQLPDDSYSIVTQFFFIAALILFFVTVSMEWYFHCRYNLDAGEKYTWRGLIVIFSISILPFVIRPICPRGIGAGSVALIIAFLGELFAITQFVGIHKTSFVIFANIDFLLAVILMSTVFAAAWFLIKQPESVPDNRKMAVVMAVSAIFALWILLNEEIYLFWYWRDRYYEGLQNWDFLAHMYMSVMWAVYGAVLMIVGFAKKIVTLRYIAIGLFGLLLVKIFIWDTRKVESVYRIAAFLATGITLVGISYVYQFGKKKGFFEGKVGKY